MIEPIIVTGVPRSRTSMTCGTLHALGAFGGDMRGPTPNNQRGMFENKRVVAMVKDYLRSMNCDPNAQHPLPSMDELKPWTNVRSQIQRAMIEDGYNGGPWFFKTVKGCHLWPVLHEAFPEAKWIIVRRDREGLINSLLRTSFMRAYQDREGWSHYIDQHEARFAEILDTCDARELHSDRVIAGDFEHFRKVIEGVGLKWNERAVRDFVDPQLSRAS